MRTMAVLWCRMSPAVKVGSDIAQLHPRRHVLDAAAPEGDDLRRQRLVGEAVGVLAVELRVLDDLVRRRGLDDKAALVHSGDILGAAEYLGHRLLLHPYGARCGEGLLRSLAMTMLG